MQPIEKVINDESYGALIVWLSSDGDVIISDAESSVTIGPEAVAELATLLGEWSEDAARVETVRLRGNAPIGG